MLFTGRIAYHDVEGLTDNLDERARLVRSLGDHNVMILRNHGLLTCGPTIAAAFTEIMHLQNTCEVQVMAQSGGAKLLYASKEIAQRTAQQYDKNARTGSEAGVMWEAMQRWMEKLDRGFAA